MWIAQCATTSLYPQQRKITVLVSSFKMFVQLTGRFMSNVSLSYVKYTTDGGLRSTWMKQDATADLHICNLSVSEQTDTLTFSVLPFSLTSTCVGCSLLRNSENNPTKGYDVTKVTMWRTHWPYGCHWQLAETQTIHSWSGKRSHREVQK